MSMTRVDPVQVLVTCDPESEAYALQELRDLFPTLPGPVWLTDGIAALMPGVSFAEFAAVLSEQPPVFVRHIAPVEWQADLRGEEADLEVLLEAAERFAPRLAPGDRFAVQSRILGEGKLPYRKFTLNNTLSGALERLSGAAMDCREPRTIVSVLCSPTRGYFGMSDTAQNRSDWPGGEHRFKRDDEQISRAEFKLLETFRTFALPLPDRGRALDLGAAPGGWTRVLRQRGLAVTAVDPADLDSRFRRDAGVQHVRLRVEEYLPTAKNRFALLVNDLRKDPLDSVEVMLQAARLLLPGAPAVLTLKLPHQTGASADNLAMVRLCLDRLKREYRIVGARQLYHNRSEVTVGLTKSVSG